MCKVCSSTCIKLYFCTFRLKPWSAERNLFRGHSGVPFLAAIRVKVFVAKFLNFCGLSWLLNAGEGRSPSKTMSGLTKIDLHSTILIGSKMIPCVVGARSQSPFSTTGEAGRSPDLSQAPLVLWEKEPLRVSQNYDDEKDYEILHGDHLWGVNDL